MLCVDSLAEMDLAVVVIGQFVEWRPSCHPGLDPGSIQIDSGSPPEVDPPLAEGDGMTYWSGRR